jgi:outer membrane protein OmpA-like peptidoglycan-associated protein
MNRIISALIFSLCIYLFSSCATQHRDTQLHEGITANICYFIPDVYFKPNSYAINKEDKKWLRKALKEWMNNPKEYGGIELRGHSDTLECNMNDSLLSYMRANKIKNYLEGHGFSREIVIKYFAGFQPKAPYLDNYYLRKDERSNRRVALVFYKN